MAYDKTKLEALKKYLKMDLDNAIEQKDDNTFDVDNGKKEYLIMTDEEATEYVKEKIEKELWTFQADFIIEHSKLTFESVEMVKVFQEKKCEDANDTIKALIEDLPEFIEDAIGMDGRGHFISSYDGAENEQDGLFIYRTN